MDTMRDSGFYEFGQLFSAALTQPLLSALQAERPAAGALFLDQATFEADPVFKGVNPRPGQNILERYQDLLDPLEQTPALLDGLKGFLGPDPQIMNKKVVMGVPESVIPDWVKTRQQGRYVNNLGAYVRPEYRDITYFWGIDLHQDIIDWPDRQGDFVTLYIYLHDVGPADAPLFLLPGSHRFGATRFPHDLQAGQGDPPEMTYRDAQGRALTAPLKKLTGPAGSAYMWHSCVLHGTQPDQNDQPRFSLRYLIARDPAAGHCGIDDVNTALDGPLSLSETREDLDEAGAARLAGNVINKV